MIQLSRNSSLGNVMPLKYLLIIILLIVDCPSRAQTNKINEWENLMKYDQMFGNYALALDYNKKLLNVCLADSMYAATKMKSLVITYCDLCYSLGIPSEMYNYLEEYIRKIDSNNKYLYPGVFYTMLSEYRGNIRDYRYVNDVHHINLNIKGDNILRFFTNNKPSLAGLNIFNNIYILLAEADIHILNKDYEHSFNILSSIEKTYKDQLNRDSKLAIYPKLMRELIFAYQGNIKEAISIAKQNLAFMEYNSLKNSSEYASELSHLQIYCNKIGLHKESIEYGNRLRKPDFNGKNQIIPSVYQVVNSFAINFTPAYYIQTKEILADSYYALGNEEEALKLIKEILEYSMTGIYRAALEKEGYKNADKFLFPLIENATLYASRFKNIDFGGNLYNSALIFKQFSLHADKLVRNIVQQSSNVQLRRIYKKLQESKAQLDIAKSIEVDSIANRISHLEAQLFNGIKRDNNIKSKISISWKEIRNALQPDEVAIEFITANISNDETSYMACIISPEMLTPQIIELCTEIDLLTLEDTYLSENAYQIIWKPLEPFLKGKKSIYFSPMGYMNNIAIEYLPIESGKTMNEQFNMFRLSTTGEILVRTEESHVYSSSVLFGGIKYDLNESEREEQIEQSRSFRHSSIQDNDEEDYSPLLRAGLSYLPGTKIEVEAIGKILSEHNSVPDIYSGIESTEELFKSLPKQKPQLLHLATHGFYIPADTKSKLTKIYGYLNKRSSIEDISMSRSGVLLTGAVNSINEINSRKNDCEDGILTAREISRLDFSSLDLVVLSACKTGLGDVNSDGVYGLQRGLKKAGAKTIIMSLWKVDDNATRIWMTEFYKNLFSGKTKQEAFRIAQRRLRDMENGKYNDPDYWASFVMLDGI